MNVFTGHPRLARLACPSRDRSGSWLHGVALIVAVLLQGSAQAAPRAPVPAVAAPAPEAERPWAKGVSAEQQERALAIYKRGNERFAEGRHADAVVEYRAALSLWEHPAIQYNLAVALIHLDQPLPAADHLDAALRFGEAPLGAEIFSQARINQKLLAGQLSVLEVRCDAPETRVMLDGELLFTAPGSQSRRLRPGRHQLVAERAGFLADTRALLLLPGERAEQAVRPRPLSSVVTRRRFAWWKPAVVLGAGLVVATAAGLPLWFSGRGDIEAYDRAVDANCQTVSCTPEQVGDGDRRGAIKSGVAIGMFSVGGALAIAGVSLFAANTLKIVAAPRDAQVRAAPLLGPGLVGGTLEVRF